jgi:hypothetical protein
MLDQHRRSAASQQPVKRIQKALKFAPTCPHDAPGFAMVHYFETDTVRIIKEDGVIVRGVFRAITRSVDSCPQRD